MTRTRTTRYVTLLSFVLALALTAALAACGSDEPSGVTGPDRTASIPTETPASGSVETDREALVALYNATDGENWNQSDNWLSDAPLGEWKGVTIDDDGRVGALYLPDIGLTGEIPAELGSLSNLEVLDIGGNALSGEIPAELGSLSNLTGLYLYFNALSGAIPAELGSLSNLTHLHLHDNGLSGEIPPELGSLSNLTHLYLDSNGLSGEIPPELGSLSYLSELGLTNNDLSGEIPPELGSLSNLSYLYLQDNDLSGVRAKQPGRPALPWQLLRLLLLLKPLALSRGRTAYRPGGAPSACWLWRMALPSNGCQPLPSSASRAAAV